MNGVRPRFLRFPELIFFGEQRPLKGSRIKNEDSSELRRLQTTLHFDTGEA